MVLVRVETNNGSAVITSLTKQLGADFLRPHPAVLLVENGSEIELGHRKASGVGRILSGLEWPGSYMRRGIRVNGTYSEA